MSRVWPTSGRLESWLSQCWSKSKPNSASIGQTSSCGETWGLCSASDRRRPRCETARASTCTCRGHTCLQQTVIGEKRCRMRSGRSYDCRTRRIDSRCFYRGSEPCAPRHTAIPLTPRNPSWIRSQRSRCRTSHVKGVLCECTRVRRNRARSCTSERRTAGNRPAVGQLRLELTGCLPHSARGANKVWTQAACARHVRGRGDKDVTRHTVQLPRPEQVELASGGPGRFDVKVSWTYLDGGVATTVLSDAAPFGRRHS